MKFDFPKEFPRKAIVPTIFAATALLCLLLSIWSAHAIERFSRLGVRRAMVEAGHTWVDVQANGLQVILTGIAPTEAMRFRALAIAGNVVDSNRVYDQMSVADQAQIAAPDFKIEILRNDDGISLIGLAPTEMDRDLLVGKLDALAEGDLVTDMLETTDHPAPKGWDGAVAFSETALKSLPRAKISVTAERVAVTAIADSAKEKREMETRLRRDAPKGIMLDLYISSPRPVIAPFTLRFLKDGQGARFDACSADSDAALKQILAAAIEAGADPRTGCTVGLGVPTPDWAKGVVMGIRAVESLGQGSITFSDADVALIAGPETDQNAFDSAVGNLESNLPDVFSLKATRSQPASDTANVQASEFMATLSADGKVELSGKLSDEMTRSAVESFARSRFGTDAVHTSTRISPDLPTGWPKRVLVALEALSELQSGKVIVHPDDLRIEGKTGSQEGSGNVARILSGKLGTNGTYAIAVSYDATLDPVAEVPTDRECVDQINTALNERKITFEPGSAVITDAAKGTLDKIAEVMKRCGDYPMEVGGHTDSQGSEEMNLSLSEQRARAVIVAIQSRRVLTGNLSAKGYGETQPIMANDTDTNRETNRRIEFRLLVPAAELPPGEIAVQTPDDKTVKPRMKPDANQN